MLSLHGCVLLIFFSIQWWCVCHFDRSGNIDMTGLIKMKIYKVDYLLTFKYRQLLKNMARAAVPAQIWT